MTLPLDAARRASLQTRNHRFAKLWQIRRRDGVFLRFTDHDGTITFENQTYTPTGGGSGTAARRESGLAEGSTDFIGVLTSAAITFEDLWSGRYNDAEVTEMLLADHRVPHLGTIYRRRYWIMEPEFDGERWTAPLSTLPSFLKIERGGVLGRTCGHTLYSQGPSKCNANPALFAASDNTVEVSTVVTSRLKFSPVTLGNPGAGTGGNGYYDNGRLLWITGKNAGLECEIKTFVNSPTPKTFELQLETPLDIQTGDLFNAWHGCSKIGRTGDCLLVFNNLVNFDGEEDVPGTDALMATPSS